MKKISKPESLLPPERVRELLDYNQDTGDLIWRERPIDEFSSIHEFNRWNTRYSGKKAGSQKSDGYIAVKIQKRPYKAHRLAWAHVHGFWPDECIDHINGICNDNRIVNLREATRNENMWNMRAHTRNPFKGVSWMEGIKKWRVVVAKDRKKIHIGVFDCRNQAIKAAEKARQKMHGDFWRVQ